MFRIIAIIVLSTLFVALALFIYYLIYRHRINKKILSSEITGKKMTDIPKTIMLGIVVLLVIHSSIYAYSYYSVLNATQTVSRDNVAVIDVSDKNDYEYIGFFGNESFKSCDFAKIYTKEKNYGYNREVKTDGIFTFTFFTRNSPADSFHPDFICFVDYNGKADESYTAYWRGDYVAYENNDEICNGTGGDTDINNSLLYIGNINTDESFRITMSVLDEESADKYNSDLQNAYEKDVNSLDDFPNEKDYAISQGSVTIRISD